MNLKIKVTKEILKKSKMCGLMPDGTRKSPFAMGDSCAIALAVRDIFPRAYVCYSTIELDGIGSAENIVLPTSVTEFIQLFDVCSSAERAAMPEIEFEITIPESVIESINISEITKLLENHPTLELVNV